MKLISACLLLSILAPICSANAGGEPCVNDVKTITIDSNITRVKIPMTPFLGINLIFPFSVTDDSALYSISSNRVFDFKISNNTNLIPLYFKQFDKNLFGTSADFTLAYEDFIFSFLLTALPEGHCSNYRFEFSDAMAKRMTDKKDKRNENLAGAILNERIDEIDSEVNRRVLENIAGIIKGDRKKFRINEEANILISDHESVVLYIRDIEKYGTYNTISLVVENHTSTSRDLFIKSFNIKGHSINNMSIDFNPKMEGNSEQPITIALMGELPKTGGSLTMSTNHGMIEVQW